MQTFTQPYEQAKALLEKGDWQAAREVFLALKPKIPLDDAHAAYLQRVFARIDAISDVTSLDINDVRGWHFAWTGSLLLNSAPKAMGKDGRFREASLKSSTASRDHSKTARCVIGP